MDLLNLKYFLTAAETENMTQAAERLNVTQPTLSVSIKRLENEVGCPLFDRKGRSIVLNENGILFQKAAESAVTVLTEAINEISEKKLYYENLIKLNCSGSPINNNLMDALLYDGISLEIDGIPENWPDKLISRESNFCITLGKTSHPSIRSSVLSQFDVVVCCGKRHELSEAKELTLEELQNYDFCSTISEHSVYKMVKKELSGKNITLKNTSLGRSSSDITRALRTGRYLSLMIKQNLPNNNQLEVLHVEGLDLKLPIYLHWLKADEKKPRLAAVRRKISEFYASL